MVEKCTGYIKKMFWPNKYGFVNILEPVSHKNQDAVFTFQDLAVSHNHKQICCVGLPVSFNVFERPHDGTNSQCRLKAEEVTPLSTMKFHASVVGFSQEDETMVELDDLLLIAILAPFNVPEEGELEETDRLTVRVTWEEMARAFEFRRRPFVEFLYLSARTRRRRSHSRGKTPRSNSISAPADSSALPFPQKSQDARIMEVTPKSGIVRVNGKDFKFEKFNIYHLHMEPVPNDMTMVFNEGEMVRVTLSKDNDSLDTIFIRKLAARGSSDSALTTCSSVSPVDYGDEDNVVENRRSRSKERAVPLRRTKSVGATFERTIPPPCFAGQTVTTVSGHSIYHGHAAGPGLCHQCAQPVGTMYPQVQTPMSFLPTQTHQGGGFMLPPCHNVEPSFQMTLSQVHQLIESAMLQPSATQRTFLNQ